MKKLEGIGYAISGGGLRSYSELAVLEDLETHNIPIAAISGASMGAAIAVLVANDMTADEVREAMLYTEEAIEDSGMFDKRRTRAIRFMTSGGAVSSEFLLEVYAKVLGKYGLYYLDDLKKPCAIMACDVDSGELILYTNEPSAFNVSNQWRIETGHLELARIVTGSCSFPYMISPTVMGLRRLVDGGTMMNQPTGVFNRSMIDTVLCSTMNRKHENLTEEPSPLRILRRCYDLRSDALRNSFLELADISVNLPVSGKGAFDMGTGHRMIEEGRAYIMLNPIDYTPYTAKINHRAYQTAQKTVNKIDALKHNSCERSKKAAGRLGEVAGSLQGLIIRNSYHIKNKKQ